MQRGLDPSASAKPLHTAVALRPLATFVDREAEARRLREAILKRQSLMVVGPRGVGKTELSLKVLAGLPASLAARCLYVPAAKDVRDLAAQIIRQLYATKSVALRRELHASGVSGATFDAWLRGQSSSQLRSALYRAIEASDYRVFLDHLPAVTLGVAKVIKELSWMRNTPVYLLSEAASKEALRAVTRFFYWSKRELLRLGPLPRAAAEQLLEGCIQESALSALDLTGFRKEVLELSANLPGAIVSMCALAAHPRYHFGNRIKTKTVYLDYLRRGCVDAGAHSRVLFSRRSSRSNSA
jgi:ABC-type transport system involved in cytochrome c biogenesis ATPase subunit